MYGFLDNVYQCGEIVYNQTEMLCSVVYNGIVLLYNVPLKRSCYLIECLDDLCLNTDLLAEDDLEEKL